MKVCISIMQEHKGLKKSTLELIKIAEEMKVNVFYHECSIHLYKNDYNIFKVCSRKLMKDHENLKEKIYAEMDNEHE